MSGRTGRAMVAGVDTTTPSCKVVVRDAASGRPVRAGSAPHPNGTEIDPTAWEHALVQAIERAGGLDDVSAVAVAAQQHGLVCLDKLGAVVRPALLWNDTRSASAAVDLVAELDGGAAAWAEAVGSVPLASFTVAKLRWLAEHEPDAAARTAAVCLPHDWLTWRLVAGLGGTATRALDARSTRSRPTAATPAARATGRPGRAATAWTCWSGPSAVTTACRCCRASSGPRTPQAVPPPGPCSAQGRATTPARRSGWGPSRGTSSSRSTRRASCPPCPCGRRPTPPASSRVSPTRPGTSCRSPARSTPRGSSTRPPPCSASTTAAFRGSHCRLLRAPTGSSSCPTSTVSARRTGRRRPGRCTVCGTSR